MPDFRFLMVFLNQDKNIKEFQIKNMMDKAQDWFHFKNSIWILYTSTSLEKWNERLQSFANEDGSFFISKLDIKESVNYQMPDGFLGWIEKQKKRKK
jgi:hypothetical protein